jgi:uncharacterized repeat protein (TIGR01451 family)
LLVNERLVILLRQAASHAPTMKRLFVLTGLLVFMLCCGQSGYSQTLPPGLKIYSSSLVDSCYAMVSETITTANGSNYSQCRIITNYGDGTKDTVALTMGYPVVLGSVIVLVGGATTAHTYALPGTYTVKKVLDSAGVRMDSVTGTVTAVCKLITGRVYKDVDTNCSYNAAVDAALLLPAHIRVDSGGVPVDTLVAHGYWAYKVIATSNTVYTFRVIAPYPAGYVPSCPSTGILSYSFSPGVIAIPSQNFAFTCGGAAANDLKLSWSRRLRAASSGGSSDIFLFAQNLGCQSTSATVLLRVSPKYSFTSSNISPAPASVSGNTITWNVASFVSGATKSFSVKLSPLSTTSIGDTACNYAIVTGGGADVNPGDNVISVCDSVRSSWDPNHKSVEPEGIVPAGTTLTYTIDFENLGNDTAFNVYIQDTLSSALDPTTLEVLSTTHLLGYAVYSYGTSTIVKFDFPDIRLAGMNYPLSNKGSVTFSIQVKPNTGNGHLIYNTAGIYFDGNPVVMTNSTFNKTPGTAGIGGVNGSAVGIKVFPNPANNALTVKVGSNGWDKAVLTNAVGQIVLTRALSVGSNMLEIGSLPAGVYHLQVKGSAGAVSEKIIKQ